VLKAGGKNKQVLGFLALVGFGALGRPPEAQTPKPTISKKKTF